MEEKKLSEFLKENSAYESFIENRLNYRRTIEDMSNRSVGIYYGFIWDKTPQGKNYWEDLYNKSLKFDIIYDIDEILYKEYERINMKESSEQKLITKDIIEGFEYPIFGLNLTEGYIVRFDGYCRGEVLMEGDCRNPNKGLYSVNWLPHSDTTVWRILTEQEALDLINISKDIVEKTKENKLEKSLKIMKSILQKTSTEEINKTIQEENMKQEDTKQELQTITLNGKDYYLVPTNISVGYIADYCNKDMKAETTEECLKRKFEEGNGEYEVLFKEKKSSDWSFCYRPNDLSWRKDWDYKLIKKEHKEIIEAYLKDNTLKIEYHHISLQDWVDKWMPYEVDLIENYDEDYCYRIAESKFIIGEKYIHKNGNTYIIKDTCRLQVNDVWIDGVIYVPENEPEQKFVRDSKNFYSSFRKEKE